MTNVLGIPVPAELVERWRDWFAPEVQPFPVGDPELGDRGRKISPSDEVRDTFWMYGGRWIWLDEQEFSELPFAVRSALLRERQATGRLRELTESVRQLVDHVRIGTRVVWWPSVLHSVGDQPVLDYVDEGVRPSRHREVTNATWRRTESLLPNAADLAGTFPTGSGPNCFGTVMAAAGVASAESEWMFQEPFEKWLAESARPIRGTDHDQNPGVIFVWRNADGLATHAAVTLGDGYALSKPSQSWCSPRLIWTVRETIMAARQPGSIICRYLLTNSDGGQTK